MIGDLIKNTRQMQYMNCIPCRFKMLFLYKELFTNGIYFQHKQIPSSIQNMINSISRQRWNKIKCNLSNVIHLCVYYPNREVTDINKS